MTVKLASTLPAAGTNGLLAITRELVDDPHLTRVVIALVDCSKVTVDTDTGDEVPTVRVRHIEVVPGVERGRVEALLSRLHDERTGRRPLFDADMVTGEIPTDG